MNSFGKEVGFPVAVNNEKPIIPPSPTDEAINSLISAKSLSSGRSMSSTGWDIAVGSQTDSEGNKSSKVTLEVSYQGLNKADRDTVQGYNGKYLYPMTYDRGGKLVSLGLGLKATVTRTQKTGEMYKMKVVFEGDDYLPAIYEEHVVA